MKDFDEFERYLSSDEAQEALTSLHKQISDECVANGGSLDTFTSQTWIEDEYSKRSFVVKLRMYHEWVNS